MDKEILKYYIEEYKKDFARINQDEIYKWYIVAEFQKNWDIEAVDFYSMLNKAIPETVNTKYAKVKNNLLPVTSGFSARNLILLWIHNEPETVRQMFKELYDENKDLLMRINQFMNSAEALFQKYKKEKENNNGQDLRAVSVYLWLRYPEKYYIYKYSTCKACAEKLKCIKLIMGRNENIKLVADIYNEIKSVIREDEELINLSKNRLNEDCYPDENLNLLTMDIAYFIEKFNEEKKQEMIKVDKCWYVGANMDGVDYFDEFVKNGYWENGYENKYLDKVKSMQVGDKIVIKSAYTQKRDLPFDVNNKFVAVMELKAKGTIIENKQDGRRVLVEWDKPWEKPKKWFFLQYRGTINKVERKDDDWIYGALLDFTFNDIKQDYDRFLAYPYWADIYSLDNNDYEKENKDNNDEIEIYTKENFLQEVFIEEDFYNNLVNVLKRKKNIILAGAPGVGKTFMAKRLVYSLLGRKDDKYIRTVQFHQSYAYEDFVMGYRPSENGFVLKTGIFYNFCQIAQNDRENEYFFIIDEINRGNISKIFGELLMLIEANYRDEEIILSYNGKNFAVPNNLYIIGMMNTADKSLAVVDYALRRRFSFFKIKPAFEDSSFKEYQKNLENDYFNKLVNLLIKLNHEISDDISLGEDFCIGHSYLCNLNKDICTRDLLKEIAYYEILPILREYYFDDLDKVSYWQDEFEGIFDNEAK